MGYYSAFVDDEESFEAYVEDHGYEDIWFTLTMFPGIGLPMQLGRRAYEWYNYGITPDRADALQFAKWFAIREALWVGIYSSSMNISSVGYWGFRKRGGPALFEMMSMAGQHAWKHKVKIGTGAAYYSGYRAWDWLVAQVSESFGGIVKHALRHVND